MAVKKKVVEIDTKEATTSVKDLKNLLRELKDVMASTEAGTEEYNNALRLAAEIQHELSEQTQLIRNSAADFGQIVSNSTSVLGGMTAGLQAAKATMNLFGIENESVIKSLQQMLNLMALTQALPALDKAFKGFKNLTTVIKTATGATHGFKAALVSTGIGAAVVAVGALVANWDKLTDAINSSIIAAEKAAQALVDSVKSSVDSVKGMLNDLNKMSTETAENLKELEWTKLNEAIAAENVSVSANELVRLYNNYQKHLKDGNAELAQSAAESLNTILKNNETTKTAFENFIKIAENLHNREVKASEEAAKAEEEAAKHKKEAYEKTKEAAEKEFQKILVAYQSLHQEINLYGKDSTEKEIIALQEEKNKKLEIIKSYYGIKNEEDLKNNEEAVKIVQEYEKRISDVKKNAQDERVKEQVEKELNSLELLYGQQMLTISQKELELSEQLASGGITSEEYQLKLKDSQQEELETLISTLEQELQVENLAADEKLAIQQRLTDAKISLNEQQVKNAEQSAQREVAKWNTAAQGIGNIFSSLGDLMEEGSEEQKAMQIMGATINMLAGITAAMSGLFTTKSGPWDIALAAIQATSIAVSGAATIAKMAKTNKNNAKSTGSNASAAAGAVTTIQAPVQYTQDIQGASIEGAIKDTRVYVTETDISHTQNRVNVAESEARY